MFLKCHILLYLLLQPWPVGRWSQKRDTYYSVLRANIGIGIRIDTLLEPNTTLLGSRRPRSKRQPRDGTASHPLFPPPPPRKRTTQKPEAGKHLILRTFLNNPRRRRRVSGMPCSLTQSLPWRGVACRGAQLEPYLDYFDTHWILPRAAVPHTKRAQFHFRKEGRRQRLEGTGQIIQEDSPTVGRRDATQSLPTSVTYLAMYLVRIIH